MDVKFSRTPAGARKPIVFDHIFAEKVGGGMIANSAFDLDEGLAMGMNSNGKFAPIKAYKVYEDADADATSIKIMKGSHIAVGDFLAKGKLAVACTAIDSTSSDKFDTVTVSLGFAVSAGDILYQSAVASVPASETVPAVDAYPIYAPMYLLGEDVPAGIGDHLGKLVNGANVRKETAPVSDDIVALMKSIAKI